MRARVTRPKPGKTVCPAGLKQWCGMSRGAMKPRGLVAGAIGGVLFGPVAVFASAFLYFILCYPGGGR
jgi:hypothetical protein